MPAVDLPTGATFVKAHQKELGAAGTVLVAVLLARIADRALSRRAVKLATSVAGRDLSPAVETRVRLVRRLVTTLILIIGLASALTQISAVQRVATGVLASSAVLGLVVGFAARQTLANA